MNSTTGLPPNSPFELLTRPWDRIQFAESRFALGRGAREGVYPRRYSTDRATKPQGKTASARRVAALLACGFVARRVTERCGYAPLLAPRHKPKSPATNCVLSHGLVSRPKFTHLCAPFQSPLRFPHPPTRRPKPSAPQLQAIRLEGSDAAMKSGSIVWRVRSRQGYYGSVA